MSSFSPERGESRRQFEKEVFPAELDYVEDRRRSVGDERDPLESPGEVSTDNELVGLALSGGGIRSASFSLGFLQSLGSRLFRRVDYISTVSGGGFIGSSISALMANAFYRKQARPEDPDEASTGEPVAPAAFPFPLTRGEAEPAALSHLRNNSDYMAPGGLGDLFRLLAVLLRGIILNSLSLLPFLLLLCLAVLLVYGQQLSDRARYDDQAERIDGLLDRYIGDQLVDDPERRIDSVLAVLETEALLRIDEGKTRGDVINQLRAPLSFERGTVGDLITGNGTEESPYRLKPGASRKNFARVLLEADVLQPYEVIEEVDLLARVLEQADYRHCQPAAAEGSSKEEVSTEEADCDYDEHGEGLIQVIHKHRMIRPGTDGYELSEFLKNYWNPQLKPVLQALYNAEFLSEEVVRDLVNEQEELAGRSPFYAYGWYESRVGEAFEGGWYEENQPRAVRAELAQLKKAFNEKCLEGTGNLLAGCLRPKTTPEDVRRLLEFEQLIAAEEALSRRPALESWAQLGDDWALLRDNYRVADLVEALYFGEYLREEWVQETLADSQRSAEEPTEEWQELASRFYDYDDSYTDEDSYDDEPPARLPVLKKETVCADLVEVLLAKGLIDTPDCPDFDDFDEEALGQAFEAIFDLLDDSWVHGQLYVYHYGWHRSLTGKPYPATWCIGTEAGMGATRTSGLASRARQLTARSALRADGADLRSGACPEVSNDSWAELSRARRDPSRWDPNRLLLPLTWVVIRLALGWVLLFPLLLIVARSAYGKRQQAIARQSNPLRALLSSDQSLDWRDLYERTFGAMLVLILGVAVIELLPYAVHHFHYLSLRGQSSRTLAIGAVSLLVTALGGPALALLQRFGRIIALATLAVAGPLLLLTVFVYTMEYAVYPPPQTDTLLVLFADQLLWFEEGGRRLLDPAAAWTLFAIISAASIGLAMLIDINATSLHGLYRDRISKAFMVGLGTEGDIEPEEDLALQQVSPPGSGAPYHLLNVALNLQGSGDRSLRGRASDFLFFSRDHVGGPRTGFCRTRDLARVFPYAHLGSAMAVSAAAVSPNMGRYKSGPMAVLMSLLNTRLALWMPHPGAVRRWFAGSEGVPAPTSLGARLLDAWRQLRLRAPATLLLRELFGATHDRGPVVNVSDGGHIENTGALELLRRRCREIIIVDGEADPDMAFGGLALLQRIARIDMGVEIEIDLGDLRPDENGLSQRRSAAGLIRYPARQGRAEGEDLVEETGKLLYVKLAVTGAEGETVAEYRARNKQFPHESTGDQAFDEGQFEAYRRLGQLAGREVFGTAEDVRAARSLIGPDPDSE